VGNIAIANPVIINNIDQEKPTGTITINNGAQYTNSGTVSLTLFGSDNGEVKEMCISDSTTCSNRETYTGSRNRPLPTPDGNKIVYARFRDEAGNVSEQASDTIRMDTENYSVTVNANGGVGESANPSTYMISNTNQKVALTRPAK
jgi:hypothetical protein